MHNLHGLPGVLGGMCSAIAAGDIRDYLYGHDVNADGKPIGAGLVMPARCVRACVGLRAPLSVARGMALQGNKVGLPWHVACAHSPTVALCGLI